LRHLSQLEELASHGSRFIVIETNSNYGL